MKTIAMTICGGGLWLLGAFGAQGVTNSAVSALFEADTRLVTAPAGLIATGVTANRNDLQWTDTAVNEVGFLIDRRIDTGEAWGVIGMSGANATNYVDLAAHSGMTYDYRVTTSNMWGSWACSATTSVVTILDRLVPYSITNRASEIVDTIQQFVIPYDYADPLPYTVKSDQQWLWVWPDSEMFATSGSVAQIHFGYPGSTGVFTGHIVYSFCRNESVQQTVSVTYVVSASTNLAGRYHFVDISNLHPVSPYTNWSTAATSIQDAIDWADPGHTVLVSSCIYNVNVPGAYIYLPSPIHIRGVNGPKNTIVDGQNMDGCFYLENGSIVEGFWLRKGNGNPGGAAHAHNGGSFVDSCISDSASAERTNSYGGGVQFLKNGSLVNCVVSNNRSGGYVGGGAYFGGTGYVSSCFFDKNTGLNGGGLYMSSRGYIENSRFRGNSTSNNGGGMYCIGYVTIAGTDYNGNQAALGGGAYMAGQSLWSNCDFAYNRSIYDGSAVYYASTATLDKCSISNNFSRTNGALFSSSVLTLTDCSIIKNIAYGNRGAGLYGNNIATLGNCIIRDNLLSNNSGSSCYGGGVFINTGSLYGCKITGNSIKNNGTGAGGGLYIKTGTVISCIFSNNIYINGPGGALSQGAGCIISNCTFTLNAALKGGGGYITNECLYISCLFETNISFSDGGGLYLKETGVAYNCRFIGNFAASNGGGAYIESNAPCIRGSLFYANVALNDGGGIGATNGGRVENCTIAGNIASNQGGGICCWNTEILNSIVYYNSAGHFQNNYMLNGSTNMRFSCVQPLFDIGVSNISVAPRFVNSGLNDYRLMSNSPCVNAGANESWMNDAVDLTGNRRISPTNGIVDMGAYEYQFWSGSSIIPAAWLARYGLPTDGSADYLDSDTDHMNNWQEWRTDCNPTNTDSFLGMAQPPGPRDPVSGGIIIRWKSSTACVYDVDRSTNLMLGAFNRLRTNMPGRSGFTTYTDTTAVGYGPYNYRVGVD